MARADFCSDYFLLLLQLRSFHFPPFALYETLTVSQIPKPKMEITEEQRKRAEANRLAALAKRKALSESSNLQQQHNPWSLFKCRKLSPDLTPNVTHCISDPRPELSRVNLIINTQLPTRFRVRLEICSPDSFSATPVAVQGFAFPGQEECLRRLSDILAYVSVSLLFPFRAVTKNWWNK